MSLRITQKIFYDSFMRQTRTSQLALFETQVELSSGRRLNRPSDDPVGTARVLALAGSQSRLDTFGGNISSADAFLATSEAALLGASDILVDVRQIAVQASNGTTSPEDRTDLANRILEAIDSLVGIANSRIGDRYVFGGTRTSVTPYDREETADGSRVTYRGNDDEFSVDVSEGLRQAVNLPGSRVFGRKEAGDLQLRGNTGLAPGAGAFSGVGSLSLDVFHDATSFEDGSGIQAGASTALDTIIGALGTHNLTVVQEDGPDGRVQTISLDGGPAVSFTGEETDLAVSGPGGEVVHLDMTGLDGSFNGQVALEATGSISLDGGTTRTPIDFTTDQRFTDPATGASFGLDSTGVVRAGKETVIFGGTLDVFQVLQLLVEDLGNSEGLSPSDLSEKINSRLDELDRSAENVRLALAEVGGRRRNLELAKSRISDLSVTLASLRSDIEDVDVTEAVTRLAEQQQALQAAMQTGSKLARLSLLNFL